MQVMQGENRTRLSDSALPAPVTPASPRLIWLFAGVALVVCAVDQATKVWALTALSDGAPREVIGSFLRLYLVRNPGAAFSLGTGSTWVLTVLAAVVLVVLVRASRRLGSLGWAWAFGLVLGGALGNLTDRLIRDPGFGVGHVVDFIDYNGWFVGNVADIAIVGAALLIGLLAIRGVGIDGRREGQAEGSNGVTRSEHIDTEEAGEGGIPAATEGTDRDG
jgi:signal peptidase II